MSTEAQVARLFVPFLERHPEFIRVGRTILRRPVGNLVLGFELQRRAYKGSVYPLWGAGIAFGPPPDFGGGIGQAVQRAIGYLGDPGIEERLLSELDLANTAFLDRVTSLEVLLEPEAIGYTGLPMMRHVRALVLAALGRLEEADELLEADICHRQALDERAVARKSNSRPDSMASRREMEGRQMNAAFLGELRLVHAPIAQRDKAGLATVLHDWERRGRGARKIEHLWEPSPFPFELGAGD